MSWLIPCCLRRRKSVLKEADGRRPTPHHTALKVIWFVLVTGCRWKDVPKEMGCCGETARTRLQTWERARIWEQVHHLFLKMLHHEKQLHLETVIIDSTQVRAFGGGDATGPSPVDRRKKGTKFTLLVDRNGVPLVIRTAPANTSDHREILPTVVEFPEVQGLSLPKTPYLHAVKELRDLIHHRLQRKIAICWQLGEAFPWA